MSKTYSKTRILVECALMIAIGTVLSNIKIFTMPNGGIRIGRCHRLDAAHAQRPGIGIRNPVRLRRNGEEPAGERRHPKNQSFHILFVKSKRGGRACGPPPRPYRDSLPTVSSSSRRSSG